MVRRPSKWLFTDSAEDAESAASSVSPEPREPADDVIVYSEPAPPRAEHIPARSPRSETGIAPAVSLMGEGAAPDDLQDAARTTAEMRTSTHTEAMTEPSQAPTALVVEDTPELAAVLELVLKRMSVRMIIAGRAAQAISSIDEAMPDIVLLDLGLPDMPGWKVLEHLKERSREDGVRAPAVVVITAYGDPANRLGGKLQGVHQYLVKPLKPDEVQQVVRSALGAPR
jgi:CheY-like chemotaxis protein